MSRSRRSTSSRKAEILPFIERLRDEAHVPIVYVSHSLAEVARLATTVVMLDDGRVAAVGSPAQVLARTDLAFPDADTEAGTLFEATVSEHDDQFGLTVLRSPAGMLRAPRLDLPVGTSVRVRIRARDVMIAVRPPDGLSALNVLRGRVLELNDVGASLVRVDLDCGGIRLAARLTRKSVETLALQTGREVYAVLKSVMLDSETLARAPKSGQLVGADASTGLVRYSPTDGDGDGSPAAVPSRIGDENHGGLGRGVAS